MGPFVPDILSEQLNLVVALILGIGFGFALEQAGFSSSRRLAGVFYGYDFTVLRVFFTAAVTAMSGVLLLGYFGLLDTDVIYVNPTWLLPALVGGAIMGAGFILGGYCPGTSVCAAAIGKVDGMFFVGGGVLGVFLFGEAYPLYKGFYESTALGPVKVFSSLGIPQGVFAFILIVVAVGAFIITTRLEKRINPENAPSRSFVRRNHFLAGAGVCLLGVVFIFLPDRKEHLLSKVADAAFIAAHPVAVMDPDELAFRIVDHEPRIRIIDIRPAAEFAQQHLPGALNVPAADFFSKEWLQTFGQRHIKKIIVGDSVAQEQSAGILLNELGYENIAVLAGGYDNFTRTILSSGSGTGETETRWTADVIRFRANARTEILRMIEEGKKAGNKGPKKEKKIQGGC